ncbi:hypothetical protein, partial [Xanthomonas campestris]|uniref:hypothetical protein n=1 Tax=Xanthomonas campestris TaxID=339 RepID=UPI00403A1B88
MSWVDNEFAIRAISHLTKVRHDATSSAFMVNYRCAICGDSQEDINKARFWLVDAGQGLRCHCFICEYSKRRSQHRKDNEPDL